ncbi:MAG: hypothetical protein JO362_21995 [Streptomycetaceae bacterium]|nr:hypothetical protein [Streptomycetaceae bacterium]
MSALPYETPAPYDPHRLRADEGPQTLAELKAALAAVAPSDLVIFNARLNGARLDDDEVRALITEYRHLLALRTRPEVATAISDSLAGRTTTVPATEVFARYGLGESAA